MSAITITKDNFGIQVKNSEKTVILDFWAEWCGPCKRISPLIDEIANERDDITVGKVNIDEEEALAAAFEIESIPTILVIKGGKLTNKMIGASNKQAILDLL